MWPESESDDTPLSNAGVKNVWCYKPTSILLTPFRHRCLQTHWASVDSGSKSVNKPSCTHRGPSLRVTSKYDQAKEIYTDTTTGRARCVPLCSTVKLWLNCASRKLRLCQQHSLVLSVGPRCLLSWSAGDTVHCSVFPSAVSSQYSVATFVVPHH